MITKMKRQNSFHVKYNTLVTKRPQQNKRMKNIARVTIIFYSEVITECKAGRQPADVN